MCTYFKASKHSGFMTIKPRYRREHIFCQDTMKSLLRTMKESGYGNSVVGFERSHKCGPSCLGPMTFESQTVGNKVRLSQECLVAERMEGTFRNGLVFSSRPVKVQERICLRVQRNLFNWHGALRVGFTNVPPTARAKPLPSMAIPDLTDTPGYWATPVNESYCEAGSVLMFWVSHGGSIYVTSNNSGQHKVLTGVDLSKPLWAMIDIYGQTCSILLLGSKKKELLYTRLSCPTPEHLTSPHSDFIPDVSSVCGNSDDCISCLDTEVSADQGSVCVVCMVREASFTLSCGHQCLCKNCTPRVLQRFGTCPLCRQTIRATSVEGSGVVKVH
ncbi:E3 ubiquitin-protein ligase NEURL3 [Thunnus thynnus]|uniref:E3 ubiquitin-protein ligase NEURL3 n=1 Tax=Thunnus thynnus TaxID=8237 RepID=UPI003526DD04